MEEVETLHHSNHGFSDPYIVTHRRMCCSDILSAWWCSLWIPSTLYTWKCDSMATVTSPCLFGKKCSSTINTCKRSWVDFTHLLDPNVCCPELGISQHEKRRLVVWFRNHGWCCRVFSLHHPFCWYLCCISSWTQSTWSIHNRKTLQGGTRLGGKFYILLLLGTFFVSLSMILKRIQFTGPFANRWRKWWRFNKFVSLEQLLVEVTHSSTIRVAQEKPISSTESRILFAPSWCWPSSKRLRSSTL